MIDATIKILNEIKSKGVEICLVSKYWDNQQLMKFYNLGYRKFGENRIDALEKRFRNLPDDIEWHFLGNIQSRDLARICKYSSLIQSFDRPDLIEKLSNFKDIKILIQINLTEDNNRNGVSIVNLDYMIQKINDYKIKCEGFMLHPPLDLVVEEKSDYFKKINELFSNYPEFSILSMGTSNDYELANNHGATMNRLGRILSE